MAFYWAAVNKDTGEIAESGKPWNLRNSANVAAKRFITKTWKGQESTIKVTEKPYPYSTSAGVS